MFRLVSSAKLNLSLEVMGRRADGYHEVLSVMQAVSLCDYMTFEPSTELEINCDLPGWQAEKSLVQRAACLMAQGAGGGAGARIRISKQIPLSSGLGGDSSNAATALSGLNRLWGLGLPAVQLGRIAAGLGADVPFFLNGGTVLAAGRGDELTPLPPLMDLNTVIFHPAVARPDRKTANLYNMLTAGDFSDGSRTRELAGRIAAGEALNAARFYNAFDRAATGVYAGLAASREAFRSAGAGEVHLAGSGPALFAGFDDAESAIKVCERLKSSGLDAWAAGPAPKTQDG